MRISRLDPAVDHDFFRACIIDLQEHERALDTRLPAGGDIATAYIETLLRRCDEWNGCILIARNEEGDGLGIASIFACVPATEPDEPPNGYALINDLFVASAARGRGIGRALLEAAETFAREQGATVLRLEVLSANHEAVELYERSGFRPRLLEMEKALLPRPRG